MLNRHKKVIKSLQPFLEHHNHYNISAKKISNAHRYKRKMTLVQGFKDLRDSQYRLDNVKKYKERHFICLYKMWIGQALSLSVIQYRISVFRIFGNEWLGKSGMIKRTNYYEKFNASGTLIYGCFKLLSQHIYSQVSP